ncbi:MAG: tetratricopeptide repeat protein [Lachnospiraceae bacterium]|nr:tetratricopeptide repeat protein [Lachnospiraceae bacterium]
MKKINLLLIDVIILMLCTGCGEEEKTDNYAAGMEAIRNLEYKDAIGYLNAANDDSADERLINRGLGLAYMGMSQYEDAISCFENALKLSDGRLREIDFDINYYLATAYYRNGQTQEAISTYDAILALRPKEKEAYYLRGCVKLYGGDFESAKADFESAISLDTQDYDRLIQIYIVLVDNGYKEVGREYLYQAITDNESSMTNYDLGRIYYYLEDYENAKAYLLQVKISSDYEAALYLGRTYEALGDYNYASSIYNDYTLIDQTKAEIYNQLGLCYMQMGEYESALTAFQTAMSIENNEMMQSLKFNEIVAYEYLEDYKAAAALMNDYLKTYPDDEAAQREYKFLKTR